MQTHKATPLTTGDDGTHVEQLTDNQWEDGGPAWQPHPPTSAALAPPN